MAKMIGSFFLLIALMTLAFQPAHADIAPPEAPPGSTLLPGSETTQVVMLAETVTLSILSDPADEKGAMANTTAFFTMRNQGNTAEHLQVRFPLNFVFFGDEGYPDISDLKVKVNGHTVVTTTQILPYKFDRSFCNESCSKDMPWAVFDVDFPLDKDVSIEVSYSTPGFGYYPYEVFRYILETGAGWKGSIGSGDVIVRLPYEANSRNVWVERTTGYSETARGPEFSKNEVRWHFENLEPTSENNIEISLVTPSLWQKVLTETSNVTKNPIDGEAWGGLGKAYKEVIRLPKGYLRDDKVGKEMYVLSKDAYERCLALLPKDSLWHAGYADLLWSHYYFDINGKADTEGVLPRLLMELQTALELDPKNQVARDLLDWISLSSPGLVQKIGSGYDFLALTATPTPFPTGTNAPPTIEPTSTIGEMPQVYDGTSTPEIPISTPISTHPQQPSTSPFCGGTTLLLPLTAGLVWLSRRRRG